MSASQTDRRPGFLQGITLLLPITMSVMGIVLLVPVLPEIMREFAGIPGAQYLVQLGILTMPAGCVLLFSPPAGALSDRYGRRPLLIASMIIYAFMGIVPMFLSNIWAIIASRVGVGICEAAIMTASTTMISDYFKGPARERWLASQTAVASMSALVLFQVAGWLGSAHGWRGPFAIYLSSLILVVGVIAFTWEPEHTKAPQSAGGSSVAAVPMPWRRLLSICALTLVAAVMFYTYQTQAGLILDQLGVHDASQRGTATMIASLGVPIGTVLFWVASRLQIAPLLCLEFLIIGVSYLYMSHAGDAHSFTMAAFANQLGCGLILPTMLTWATHGLPFEIRGRCTGWWTGAFVAGQFLSGGLMTFLGNWLGGLLKALGALGVVSLVAAAGALLAFIAIGNCSGGRLLRAVRD
jgi:MFS family permease